MAAILTHGLGRHGTRAIPFASGGLGAFVVHFLAAPWRRVAVALEQRRAEVSRW